MMDRRIFLLAALAAYGPAHAQTAVHPAEDYKQAASLFQAGQPDEAVYRFYRGQYRYRVHLAARPELPKSGDPALFGALTETVGTLINTYAFGDIPALVKILDRVIADVQTQDDDFTPKAQFAAAHERNLKGLIGLRAQIDRERDTIRAARTANGLENRN